MKALSIQLATCLALLTAQSSASAQCCGSASYAVPTVHPYYGGAPLWHHHASTAAEGYARGVAAVLYAQGAYNRLSAEARVIHSQAYAQELENRQRAVDTFFNVRATNRRARAAERGDRPTFEELAKLAKDSAPPRLDDDRLDPASGQIDWPAALREGQFAAYRARLEQFFAYRAARGKFDSAQQRQVRELTDAMLVQLKDNIRQLSPMEYAEARGFLNSLAYEAQLPV